MFEVQNLNVYYGDSHVIRNIGFSVGAQETVAIMGRNGMGKTTLLKSLIGVLPARSGDMALDGKALLGRKSYERVAAGLAYVPQGRMIFPYLTVEENILSGMENMADKTVPQFVYDTFPDLHHMRHRKGGNLSGGQQQQLAISRALVANPKVLILDEPTEGIQPSIIKDIGAVIRRLVTEKKMAVLLVEQYYDFAESLADAYAVMSRGQITHRGSGARMKEENVVGLLAI